MSVEPEHLADLPLLEREIIARWLVQRGEQMGRAAHLFGREALASQDALLGAAVDLVDPLSEDSTLGHASEVLARLR